MKRTYLNHAGSLLLLFSIGSASFARGAWTQQAKLTPSDSTPNDEFGWSVALQGGIAIVGAPNINTETGAAYVFVQTGGVWTQEAELTPSDAAPWANFGVSVALSGDTAIVGADGWGGFDSYIGAAYVFVRSGTVWTQQAEFKGTQSGTEFGISVALGANTAIVGSWGIPSEAAGAAYVFTRSGPTWTQTATLTPSDSVSGDQFGLRVALSGNTALIGAPFAAHAYVFTSTGTSWSQQAILAAPSGSTSNEFGYALALQGDTALVGAYNTKIQGQQRGAVYSFSRTGVTWTLNTEFAGPKGALEACGQTAALGGTTALIGCNTENTDNGAVGGVFVFEQSGSAWSLTSLLVPTDGGPWDHFGEDGAAALSGGTALIGSSWVVPNTPAPGAAYIFVHTSN